LASYSAACVAGLLFACPAQAQRASTDEAQLPPAAEAPTPNQSLWTHYRSEAAAVLVILALQALIIVALLLHIRKRRVERKLQETEDRYRKVVESQTELICRYLPDTTLTFVNDAYCRFFNRAREDLIGKQFASFLDEAYGSKALAHVRSLAERPRTESHIEWSERPDGSLSWQRWTDNPILDESGRVVEIQSIGHDVTDLKLAEQEARQRREQVTHLTRVAMLGELSAALAHELYQPITAVLTNAQVAEYLLSRDPPDLDEVREIVRDIITDDIRAGEVISRLRSLLKPGHQGFETFDMSGVIADVVTLVRGQLTERRVELVQRLAPDLPLITGDRVQLQQVLLNLIVNACDAMSGIDPANRVVIIEADCANEHVRVAVTDYGCGLSSDVADRLFEPFVTTKPDGLGLGLSICRSIVRAHGGRLAARNNPERGATLEFTVPIAKARQPVSEAS
jgi:PAS domain S-box-containing protein